tara:strand:- start:2685 stop:3005 length:321 start_codon:yes stop_codon:yes gene_type:complete
MREQELEKRLNKSNEYLKAMSEFVGIDKEARVRLKAAIVKNQMAVEIVDKSEQSKSVEPAQAIDTYLEDPNSWLTKHHPYFNMMDRNRWFEAMSAYGKFIYENSRK